MDYADSILGLVGETPLVRLSRVTRELGPAERQPLILAKLEMLNPGGSVKDRIGLPMIEAAERAGLLKPGGTIIEPTSGNTGHGLVIAAALKGYRCIFVMADKQSKEKQDLLRAYGAEVVLCPTNVPPESPESYYSVARRLTRDIPGAFQPDQYHNMENPTGPRADHGTRDLAPDRRPRDPRGHRGRDRRHHQRRRATTSRRSTRTSQVIGADPEGSVLSGDTARPYLTEGVGEDFFPGTFDRRWSIAGSACPTRTPSPARAGSPARKGSWPANRAARRSSRRSRSRASSPRPATGQDAVVVVLLADSGRSYLSKLYDDEWLRKNGLVGLGAGRERVRAVLADRHHGPELPSVVLARTTDTVAHAIETLQRCGISQMPVTERDDDAIEGIVGSVDEKACWSGSTAIRRPWVGRWASSCSGRCRPST